MITVEISTACHSFQHVILHNRQEHFVNVLLKTLQGSMQNEGASPSRPTRHLWTVGRHTYAMFC